MKRFLFAVKIFLVLILAVPTTGMSVNAAANSGRCSKVGQTKVSKKIRYVCVKTGSKTIWQIRSSKAKPGSTSVTENTTVKSQTFFAPNVASDGSGSCEIQERSAHRATYPKGPFVGFPRRPITSFRNSGVITYAMIPLDWSDLPGNKSQLDESVSQAKLFETWMETVSQGKVQINWKLHPSWVRMPGASSSWYTPRAFPANVAFGDAAFAAADSAFDFSSVDAVVFFLPKGQGVVIEGTQGAVDTGLERSFNTAEGSIPAFAVTGKYFEQENKNYWSAWVHYSLIWMGMAELFDARSNGEGAAQRAIPTGNMGGYDIMASQDGPNRQLSGWLRFLLDWLSSDQVYCKKLDTMANVKLSLEPVGNVSSKLKMVGIQISDTKLVAIESRRLDNRFDCLSNGHFKKDGVVVYVVDSTQGHVTGETLSLVSPSSRILLRSYCNTPTQQNPVLNVGDSVDVLGLRIKVLESGAFDTIEITRL
jgi:hypothetical protein